MAKLGQISDAVFREAVESITLADVNRAFKKLRKNPEMTFQQYRTRYIEDDTGRKYGFRAVISIAATPHLEGGQLGREHFQSTRESICIRQLKRLGVKLVQGASRANRTPGPVPMPLAGAFRKALLARLNDPRRAEWSDIEIRSLHLHQEVEPRTTKASIALCCQVMREEMQDGDTVTSSTKQGRGALVTVKYLLPRVKPGGYQPGGRDTRKRVLRGVVERPGQGAFREMLFAAHGCGCMVTGITAREAIEAAHINPYQGEHDDHVENGLLLRADIHALFDRHLLGIEPTTLKVVLHPSIARDYASHEGRRIQGTAVQPSKAALQLRFERFQQKLRGRDG